jgi:hypothetical protein
MALDIEEVKKQVEQQVEKTSTTVQDDGWGKAFDDIIQGDFTGFSTLIVVLLFVLLLKPILYLLQYVIAGFIIFMIVKYFLFYNAVTVV